MPHAEERGGTQLGKHLEIESQIPKFWEIVLVLVVVLSARCIGLLRRKGNPIPS
jgi:hypothetical protein